MTDWGYWGVAVLMIVLASWIFYRFAAPKSWREWTSAGLVQGFIIALYAEMYGFPLTLYVLTRIFGIEVPWVHFSGHLWAILLGYGFVGGLVEMTLGYIFVVLGVFLLARGWYEVHAAVRAGRLVSAGLYSVVRHPQYAGILLAIIGQLIHWPTIPTLALAPFIMWAYVRLARREEAELEARFGDEYRAYRASVPRFLPRLRDWGSLLRASGGFNRGADEMSGHEPRQTAPPTGPRVEHHGERGPNATARTLT